MNAIYPSLKSGTGKRLWLWHMPMTAAFFVQ